ncbi:MAG: dihydrofolate reductase family protein, partial [Coriobacteriia bacterium]|nr:dihydrofolate reductase family protein [Coriobacteriia bacterium]
PHVKTLAFDGAAGIRGALHVLGEQNITHLLVEAGPGLLSALWDAAAIDELVLIHAGGMAGQEAPTLFSGASVGERDALERNMEAIECGIVGRDAVTVWRPAAAPPGA